jgi:hypothetical protein
MLDDAQFRLLMADRKWKIFMDARHKADFTPAQRDAFRTFANYVNELARMLIKEEGAIVKQL